MSLSDDQVKTETRAEAGSERGADPTTAARPMATAEWLRTGRGRLQFMGVLFAVCFAVIAFRISEVMLLGEKGELPLGRVQISSPRIAERADIVDRNGVLLASNLFSPSLYADARVVLEPEKAADELSRILPELSRAEIIGKLRSGRAFVWLKRNLTPHQHYQINSLGIPGLAFQEEQHRVYPLGNLAAHVMGFVDIDNNGIAGVESFFDEALKGHARGDEPLILSLDVRVQHALRDELHAAMGRYRASGAGGIVLDVRTSEILGLASLPDYDSNHAGTATEMARFNRISLGVYELGSVFKLFNTAMALDSGKVTLKDGYDASKPLRVSRFVIRDAQPKKRWLSVPEIFVFSSNIGSAKMALDIGTERQQAFLQRLGMLRRAAVEMPEVGTPLSPSPWREVNTMTVAFGHGLAVSPLQLASAAAAIVNGGIFRPATVLKRQGPPPAGLRVVSKRTSDIMRRLLRAVVVEGSAKKADVPGYLIGGKTGTAEKAGSRGYDRRTVISSFLGIFPMTAPRYLIYVLLDEPRAGEATPRRVNAGWNAAPTSGRIITRIAPLLGVGSIDETAAEVSRAMHIALNSRRPRRASF